MVIWRLGRHFGDTFESSIHNNTDLSAIHKFNYLSSLLEGNAATAISGLTLSSANYDEAVVILKKRFGNRQQIITKHMDVLMSLEAVTSNHNLEGLRHLYDLVESHVRSLRSLAIPSSSYGSLLSSIFMMKLPQELQVIVSREITNDEWDLDSIMKTVEKEIDARERASVSVCPVKKQSRKYPTAAATYNHPSKTFLRAPNISHPVDKVTTLLRLLIHRHRRPIQLSPLLYYPCTSVPEPLCCYRQQELKSSNLTNPLTPWMSE